MRTRDVALHTGIIVGSGGHSKTVTIREGTLDDEMTLLESGQSGMLLYRKQLMRRVTKIGPLDNPSEEIVRKLTDTDWELIEKAMGDLDQELAKEAGLLDKDEPAGRDEPGKAATGDV